MSESKEMEIGENGGKKRKEALFPVEIEIKLLEELLEFQQERGSVSWRGFHETTSQKSAYTATQISELMRRLKASYFKTRSQSHPPPDPQKRRIHELSAALWSSCPDSATPATRKRRRRGGSSPSPSSSSSAPPIDPHDFPTHFPLVSEYFNDVRVPELLRSHWVFMGSAAAQEFERRRRELKAAQLRLCEENLGLNKDMSVMVAEMIKRPDINLSTPSPSTSPSSSTT